MAIIFIDKVINGLHIRYGVRHASQACAELLLNVICRANLSFLVRKQHFCWEVPEVSFTNAAARVVDSTGASAVPCCKV